jgi:uridine kinase
VFNKVTKTRDEKTEKIYPTPIVILEGHYLFNNEALMKLIDCKIFLDTDDDVKLSRMVMKFTKTNSSDINSLKQFLGVYEKQIKPAYEKWIEPAKKYADIIVPNYVFSLDASIFSE